MKLVKSKDLKFEKRFCYTKAIPFELKDTKFQIVKFPHQAFIKEHYHLVTQEIFYIKRS